MKPCSYKNKSRFADNGMVPQEDLRDEFEETLSQTGAPYVARVVDRERRCRCIALRNDRSNEPDPSCKICDTLGFLYNDKDITAYKSYEDGKEQGASPRRMRSDHEFIYTHHHVFTDRWQAEFSRVGELLVDDNGNIDPRRIIVGWYDIKDGVPYAKKGKLIYWRLCVQRKDV